MIFNGMNSWISLQHTVIMSGMLTCSTVILTFNWLWTHPQTSARTWSCVIFTFRACSVVELSYISFFFYCFGFFLETEITFSMPSVLLSKPSVWVRRHWSFLKNGPSSEHKLIYQQVIYAPKRSWIIQKAIALKMHHGISVLLVLQVMMFRHFAMKAHRHEHV